MEEANLTNLSDEDPTKMCVPCSFRRINTQAGFYYQVCSEYLCDTCEAVHRRARASHAHEFKPLNDLQRRV